MLLVAALIISFIFGSFPGQDQGSVPLAAAHSHEGDLVPSQMERPDGILESPCPLPPLGQKVPSPLWMAMLSASAIATDYPLTARPNPLCVSRSVEL